MWPLILVALVIFLILIVLSVCAYPYICAVIVVVLKKIKTPVTGFLLLLTIALYFFACIVLEGAFDNWCYSVYAGIALTPITLFICTGVADVQNWPQNNESILHKNITIPILTAITSIAFTIEGCLRMANAKSAYFLLNYGFIETDEYEYLYFHQDFKYAGIILFGISIISALIIVFCSYSSYVAKVQEIKDKKEREARIEGALNEISQSLNADLKGFDLLPSDSKIKNDAIQNYNLFCQSLATAFESIEEKGSTSCKRDYFNEINSSYQAFIISTKSTSYYLYPVGVVAKFSYDKFKYIPYGRMTLNLSTEQITKSTMLPASIKPIRQFWQHTCRDGSPDLRYKYNPKTYVYLCTVIHVDALKLHVYNQDIAKRVEFAYTNMYKCLCNLKSHVVSNKTNKVIKKEPEVNRNVSDNPTQQLASIARSESIQISNKSELQDSISNKPQNLEECFIEIIKKHGIKVLNDGKQICSIITQYKDIVTTDYIEIIEKMATENYYSQFSEPNKQNDFALYNISSTFARNFKLNAQICLNITQALVSGIKRIR